jgi:hypothetical protein
MATLFVDKIDPQSGTSLTIGSSGDTVALTSGVVQSNMMYPAFEARLSGNQGLDHATFTKVQCGDEVLDTDTAYDNSTNYRFTPQVAGKYYVYGSVRGFAGGSDGDAVRIIALAFYKNGSQVRDYNGFDTDQNEMRHMEVTASTIIEFNGSSDYLELFGYIFSENGLNPGVAFNGNQTYFGAYRIGS